MLIARGRAVFDPVLGQSGPPREGDLAIGESPP
jgi:hypothetical protein